MKVVVTGASGKAGRAVVRDLGEHDYDVVAIDVSAPADSAAPYMTVALIPALKHACGRDARRSDHADHEEHHRHSGRAE